MNSIFKVGDQTIQPGRAWKDSDGTLQPKNWQVWSADEKKAAGISEIIMQPLPDQTLYSSSHNADGSVNSTARPLADTVRQTQARNSDGAYVFLDPDNKEVSYNNLRAWTAEGEMLSSSDPIDDYFECISECSPVDKQCITSCRTLL